MVADTRLVIKCKRLCLFIKEISFLITISEMHHKCNGGFTKSIGGGEGVLKSVFLVWFAVSEGTYSRGGGGGLKSFHRPQM